MARRTFVTGRKSKSLKTWLGQAIPAFGTDLTAPGGAISAGLKAFGTPIGVDVTVLRTRGQLTATVGSGVSASSEEVYQIALGIGLCTTEAAAAGAVPLPFDNPEWDGWFVYQVAGFTAKSGDQLILSASMDIDSKAMRKIPSGQVLFLATQTFTAVGVSASNIHQTIQIRQLQKTS